MRINAINKAETTDKKSKLSYVRQQLLRNSNLVLVLFRSFIFEELTQNNIQTKCSEKEWKKFLVPSQP
jgi:hypothetical protein